MIIIIITDSFEFDFQNKVMSRSTRICSSIDLLGAIRSHAPWHIVQKYKQRSWVTTP